MFYGNGPSLSALCSRGPAMRPLCRAMDKECTWCLIFVLGGLATSDGLETGLTSTLLHAKAPSLLCAKVPFTHLRFNTIRPVWRLRGGDDAFEAALELKAAGTDQWSQSNYTGAVEQYSAALKLLSSCSTASVLAHREESINCLNNRAASYFKLGEYAFAITDCTEALSLDPANKKVGTFLTNHFVPNESAKETPLPPEHG